MFSRHRIDIIVTPTTAGAAFGTFALFSLLAYAAWQLMPAFRAPLLAVTEPPGDRVQEERRLDVTGSVLGAFSRLTLNGQDVYVGEDGKFSQHTYLGTGVNSLEIVAVSKFGREAKITRQVIVHK